MDSVVTLRDEPATTVAYLRRQGPYAGMPDGIHQLYAHLLRAHLNPAGPPICVFFTDPLTVPEDRAQWEVRWQVTDERGAVPAESEPGADGVGVRRLPARTVAVLNHVGPYSAVTGSYLALHDWVGEHLYTVVGPPEEAYVSEPDTPQDQLLTEIRLPVALEPVAHGV